MKPYPYKRNLNRSPWDHTSTSSSSVDQLLLSVMSKQPHWWQFRAVCLKTFSRFAHLQHAVSCWWEEAERVWVAWSWPRCGVALPGIWEPGTATSWRSWRGFRSGAGVSACRCSAPWRVGMLRGSFCVYFCATFCSCLGKPSVFSGLWTLKSISQLPAIGTQYNFSGPTSKKIFF